MDVLEMTGDFAVVRLARQEILLVNNALNEVCNGVHINDWEFQTRLGARREALRDLLERIGSLLDLQDGSQ